MDDPTDAVARWLAEARTGVQEALGQALQACRPYLLLIAEGQLDPALRAKGGASDLVQETFLEAQRDFVRFHGTTEAELRAWLRQLLLHNLSNFARRYCETGKRQLNREVPLQDGETLGAERVAAPTPPPGDAVIAAEETAALQRALQRLPDDYRRVLTLRYHEGRSFDEIARLLGRSANAVRKLFARAVERMEEELAKP